jgi:rubrerythrin
MKERTKKNVHDAFVGEAKAHQRLLAFAKKADDEGLPVIGKLFRAVAASESVHSRRHFGLLEAVADTQTNLEKAFQGEQLVNGVYYPQMIREAEEDEEKAAAIVFTQARDVEVEHEKLYKRALDHLMDEREDVEYYICAVCGHIHEGEPPDRCPICNAPKSKFERVN